jgi:hypothetical protein
MLGAHTVSKFDYYSGYDAEAYEMALDAARQIADKDLFPYYMEMDRKKAICEAGVVTTHPQLKTIIQSVAEGGWIAAHHPQEVGGSQILFLLLGRNHLKTPIFPKCFLAIGKEQWRSQNHRRVAPYRILPPRLVQQKQKVAIKYEVRKYTSRVETTPLAIILST